MNAWSSVLTKLRRYQNVTVGAGCGRAEQDHVEATLGVTLPDEYRAYLETCGWLELAQDEILGYSPQVPRHLDVIRVTQRERQEMCPRMPEYLLVVMNDGCGNYYCLDLRSGARTHAPVVFWDHEAPAGEDQSLETIETSFTEWLRKYLDSLIDSGRLEPKGGEEHPSPA